MTGSTAKELASRFVAGWVETQVVPLDDQTLEMTDFNRRVDRRRKSQGCREYLLTVAGLLAHTRISTYFGKQLLYESYLGYGSGFTSPEPLIHIAKDHFGIDLKSDEYGFFDPKKALEVERVYFEKNLPFMVMRENEGKQSVSLDEWNRDLAIREIAGDL